MTRLHQWTVCCSGWRVGQGLSLNRRRQVSTASSLAGCSGCGDRPHAMDCAQCSHIRRWHGCPATCGSMPRRYLHRWHLINGSACFATLRLPIKRRPGADSSVNAYPGGAPPKSIKNNDRMNPIPSSAASNCHRIVVHLRSLGFSKAFWLERSMSRWSGP